jgi:hypothetical protein
MPPPASGRCLDSIIKEIMMKMKKLGGAIALALASSVAAADYRAEIGAAYTDIDGEVDILAVAGELHFSPVSTATHPLAEAAFLEKSSSVSLTYAQSDTDYVEAEAITGGLEFYIPQAMLYVAPFYVYSSYDAEEYAEGSENDWGVTAGLAPFEGFRVTTTWSDEVDYELNFAIKQVVKLAGEQAINAEFAFTKASDEDGFEESDDIIQAALDYYIDHTFSIGIELANAEDTSYGFRTQKFFTENFSALAAYYTADEADSWLIGASLRF